MLADSSIPTGSFAHSSGLEAAAQLGIVKDEQGLETFIQAVTWSTMQVMMPFLLSGHRLALEESVDHESHQDKWKELDQQVQPRWIKASLYCEWPGIRSVRAIKVAF